MWDMWSPNSVVGEMTLLKLNYKFRENSRLKIDEPALGFYYAQFVQVFAQFYPVAPN